MGLPHRKVWEFFLCLSSLICAISRPHSLFGFFP